MLTLNRRQVGKSIIAATLTSTLSPAQVRNFSALRRSASLANWESVAAGIWKVTVGKPEAYTPVKSRLTAPNIAGLRNLAPISEVPMRPIQGEATERGTLVSIPLQPQEDIYGLGLQFMSYSQRGKKKTTRVNADPRVDSGDSHAPVPFYVSTRGYGILVDTARYAAFYLGDAMPRTSKSRLEESAGEKGAIAEDQATASNVFVEIPRSTGVDVYLFAGPTILDVVRRYNLFSGGGVFPPEWGLGFWYRAYEKANQNDVVKLLQEFRISRIPCSVIGLEPGWQSHAYPCTFTWDEKKFPDPRHLLQDLNQFNVKLNLWEHAFISPASPLSNALQSNAGDMKVLGGLVPDFVQPEARRIFGDFHGKTLIDIGVAGFKLDECDNSDFTGGWSFPEFTKFPSGVDGEQMHSVFGLRYQQLIWDQYKERGLETFGLVRSSGALAAPYPFVLYSDLYDHRQFIRALVNSSFCGLLWCPEVRDAVSEEDFIRRLQSVVFSPVAMVDGWYVPNPPWKQLDAKKNNDNLLMDNWKVLETRSREIIEWRMRIVPYLRAAFSKYAVDGTPPFRSLVLDWPADSSLAQVDDEYMVGDRMLVAPLFAGENERTVTLPEGTWHDFWTGRETIGGSSFSVPGATREIPVYVKAGSVLPLATATSTADDIASRELTVCIFGDGSVPFSMNTLNGHSLDLHWNPKTLSGSVKQVGGDPNPYRIVRWQQMA